MKKIKLIFALILSISTLAFSISAYASGIALISDKDSASVDETVEITVSIVNSKNVSSGSISISHGTSTIIMDGGWTIDNTSISTYDDMTEKGAFMIEGERKISGNIFTFEAKLAKGASGANDIKATVVLQNDEGDVFNETGSVSITASGTSDVTTEATATAQSTTATETTTATSASEAEDTSEKTDDVDEAEAEDADVEDTSSEVADASTSTLSSNIVAYLIFGGAVLILIIVIIVTFKKSKK